VEKMWITVEKTLNSGDITLGISKSLMEGFSARNSYPQLTPQVFTAFINKKVFAVRELICNYKTVISLTHLLTAVITTNFINKSFFPKVPVLKLKSVLGAAI
jgi:hypothetical protein